MRNMDKLNQDFREFIGLLESEESGRTKALIDLEELRKSD